MPSCLLRTTLTQKLRKFVKLTLLVAATRKCVQQIAVRQAQRGQVDSAHPCCIEGELTGDVRHDERLA